MPRDMRADENRKRAKARRDFALERNEFRYPSEPRIAPDGPTSFPLKADNIDDRRLIDEALARRAHARSDGGR